MFETVSNANSDLLEVGLKVIMIGDTSVGKSSVISRLTQNTFNENIKATIGCDYFEKEMKLSSDLTVKLSIWDTAGQERFRGLASSYYKKAKGIILCYDITRKQSFVRLGYWLNEIDHLADKDVLIFLLGCKSDQADKRVIPKDVAETYAKNHKFKYCYEVNSVDGADDILDFFDEVTTILAENNKAALAQQETKLKGGPRPTVTNPDLKLTENDKKIEKDKKDDCKC